MVTPTARAIVMVAILILFAGACTQSQIPTARNHKKPSRPSFVVLRDTSKSPAQRLISIALHTADDAIYIEGGNDVSSSGTHINFKSKDSKGTLEWECRPQSGDCDDWQFWFGVDGTEPLQKPIKYCGSPVVMQEWSHYAWSIEPTDPST